MQIQMVIPIRDLLKNIVSFLSFLSIQNILLFSSQMKTLSIEH